MSGSPARVLYVDHEPTLVFPITRALGKPGIEARGFASAQESASGCIDPAGQLRDLKS